MIKQMNKVEYSAANMRTGLYFVLNFFLSIFLLSGAKAMACSCPIPDETRDTINADIVVLAKATEKAETDEYLPGFFHRKFIVEFIYKDIPKIKEYGAMLIWRPIVGREITILQKPNRCAYHFEVGKLYKIYGRLVEGNQQDYTRLVTDKCSGTRLYKAAAVNICDSNTVLADKNTLLDFGNRDPAVVKAAMERIFQCYKSKVEMEKRVVNPETGEEYIDVVHRIDGLNLLLYFSNGKLVNVSEIKR
jgi:hypothetical protein